LNGDINCLLYPINHGILHFVGFDVLPPFIAYACARVGKERREQYLREYEARLRTWHITAPIPYHPLDDYDETNQLKAGLDDSV
jgi:NAD(P)H dehydrogenase (quinone)